MLGVVCSPKKNQKIEKSKFGFRTNDRRSGNLVCSEKKKSKMEKSKLERKMGVSNKSPSFVHLTFSRHPLLTWLSRLSELLQLLQLYMLEADSEDAQGDEREATSHEGV